MTGVARVQAGITLHDLSLALHQRGRALQNLGDIDRQTLAGALSTATHGTGESFGNLSTQMVGGRLVTADGTVRELADPATRTPDLLRAARVSLGALGVLSEVSLQTVPAFRLHKRRAAAAAGRRARRAGRAGRRRTTTSSSTRCPTPAAPW